MDGRLLGTGGWLPTDRRETACVYLRKGADVLVLDAGTGLRRLVTEPELLAGVERLHIALTHFHLDHSVGLIALPALAGRVARQVWAPGEALYGATTDSFVRTLVGPPFLFVSAEELEPHIGSVHELAGEAEIGPFHVETRVQSLHTGPTLALKVDGWLAYCTDTAYDEENASFVRGARVLLHEAMHASDRTDDPIHSAAGEAARVAAAASVDRLVLVHINPTPGAEEGLLDHALERFPQAEVGRDGVTV
jgi:ribonuclease BN (tRNA processing enzyme)